MTIAYLDCFSGISGDMFIGALLHAGLPFDELKACLRTLPLHGYHLEMRNEERSGILALASSSNLKNKSSPHETLQRF